MILTKEHQVRSKTPKKYKKPKKARVKTPRPEGPYMCYECGCSKYLEIHHCSFGDKYTRDKSSEYKCVEWLCYHHHRGQPDGVHGGNKELDLELKIKHQIRLMDSGMSMDDFIDTFGRSYV